ncbi:MAG: hypothetical protein AMS18_07410 [Gemmatimonas sp. SG8_17]|nr:MAG: hypothetical protein AMS18_07410 [Gemmatimonas sp. SG8_17]
MLYRTGGYLLVAALVLSAVSCTRLSRTTPHEGPAVAIEEMPYSNSVPLEWGQLISVTADATWPASTLWFQNEAGEVRLVGYHYESRRLLDSVAVIVRR